jgi:trehalose 6-phosphate synthase/phosphatase
MAHQDALTPQGKQDGRKRGLCILSEFSSCTRVMRGALHVNPWKVRLVHVRRMSLVKELVLI